jgi:hypothetical protein
MKIKEFRNGDRAILEFGFRIWKSKFESREAEKSERVSLFAEEGGAGHGRGLGEAKHLEEGGGDVG